jgi:uncharacterized GH25 family protein
LRLLTIRQQLRSALVCLSVLLLAGQATAHDFWIEPSSFSPAPGQAVAVRLLVGEHLEGEPVARPPSASLHRFIVMESASRDSASLPGRTGGDPAAWLRLTRPGLHIIGFHGKHNALELEAEKFNAYLKEEGLEAVLEERAARGETNRVGREIYSRCAKSLLVLGSANAADGDRVLGFPLELVAESHPSSLRVGEPVAVRLLYRGRPLRGALVVALQREAAQERITARSDADGRVRLPLPRAGAWLVKAVHMVAAPESSGAEWESLWASLTFEMPSLAPTN